MGFIGDFHRGSETEPLLGKWKSKRTEIRARHIALTQLVPSPQPCGENETKWLNSLFFFLRVGSGEICVFQLFNSCSQEAVPKKRFFDVPFPAFDTLDRHAHVNKCYRQSVWYSWSIFLTVWRQKQLATLDKSKKSNFDIRHFQINN